MTPKEKDTIAREKKQLQGFIDCIRTENEAIGKRLASMISLVGSLRASQLGIGLILTDLEKKLKK